MSASTPRLTIVEHTTKLIAQGKLIPWSSDGAAASGGRCLLLTSGALSRLNGLKEEALWEAWEASLGAYCQRILPLRQQFKSCAHGGLISEMRIQSPNPGLRLIGAFVDHETFICTAIHLRSEITFKHTDSAGKLAWRDIGDRAMAEITELLSAQSPVKWKDIVDAEE